MLYLHVFECLLQLLVHAGPVELAAVGVSIALFNQVSRIAIFPLVSVTTSFVAEEDTLSGASPQIEEGKCLEAGGPVDTETKELLPQKGIIPLYHSFVIGLVSGKFSWLLLKSNDLLLCRKTNKRFCAFPTRPFHFLGQLQVEMFTIQILLVNL